MSAMPPRFFQWCIHACLHVCCVPEQSHSVVTCLFMQPLCSGLYIPVPMSAMHRGHQLMAWAHLFTCFLCPSMSSYQGMIDHMPTISHYHHLAVWASLFACTLCPSTMMYVHTPAMSQCQKIGKLSTPVHPPDTSLFCRMAERSCLFAYLQCFRAAPWQPVQVMSQ